MGRKPKEEKEKVVKVETNDMKEKREKVDKALAEVEKKFGKGSIVKLGENRVDMNVKFNSTGILSLDKALGMGLPEGRIIEVYGQESSGKTTVCEQIVATFQKNGKVCAIIDSEHAIDPNWAKKIGVDIDNLYISQPDSGEQALEICETMVRSGGVDLIVVDSVAALVPQSEIDGDMGDSVMGLQARLMSQACRKLTAIINKSKCTVIFINQIREKIGVMFGNPNTTTGGKALKFYATIRMEVSKKEAIKEEGEIVGNRVKVKVVKNKVAPPFRECEYDIYYDRGISRVGDLVDVAESYGILEKSGSWYAWAGEKIGQGKPNTVKYFEEKEDQCNALEKEVREIMEKERQEMQEEMKAQPNNEIEEEIDTEEMLNEE